MRAEVNLNACLKGEHEERRCEMVRKECAWGIGAFRWTVHADASFIFSGDGTFGTVHVDDFLIWLNFFHFLDDFIDLNERFP